MARCRFYFLTLSCILKILLLSVSLVSSLSMTIIEDEILGAHFPTATATNISMRCQNDSLTYLQAYMNREKWASKMYKATGLLSFESLKNFDVFSTSAGLYDECLSIESPASFQGQYCSAFFERNGNPDDTQASNSMVFKERDGDGTTFLLPRIGFCIPSSCNPSDFRLSVNQLVSTLMIGHSNNRTSSIITIVNDENYCYTRKKIESTPKFDWLDIIMLLHVILWGLVVITGTLYDVWRSFFMHEIKEMHILCKFLHCFSASGNGRKLLSTEANNSLDLSCLHGIRFLSASWIILFHTHRFINIAPMDNKFGPNQNHLYEWDIQAFSRGSISVDTFFMMSGLLVCYSMLKELKRNEGRLNLFSLYLHRYIRLTPFYALYFGFIATLLVYLGSGPLWHYVRLKREACRSTWWTHFFYINNYFIKSIPPADCMIQSWYLAADMQLFIISPLFIYPLWRWKNKFGLAWVILVLTTVIVAITTVYLIWDLPATNTILERPIEAKNSLYPDYYFHTWPRLPQYLIGILLGWFISKSSNNKYKLNWIIVSFGWILSMSTVLFDIYGLVPFLNEDLVPDMNPIIKTVYGTLRRFGWAAAVCWIVFACLNGYGGFVNSLLTWKGFIPLSRLSYIAFLVHLDYIKIYYNGLSRAPLYYTKVNAMMTYFGVIVVTFILASFFTITIEMPFMNLEQIFMNRTKNLKADAKLPENGPDAGGHKINKEDS